MRKVSLIIIAAVCALAWTSRNQAAYAASTISCQGHDTVVVSPCNSPTVSSTSEECADTPSIDLFNISDVAIWSVTTLGSKLTGGVLLATFQSYGCTYTCDYTLDPKNSTFFTSNGILTQELTWFTDEPWCEDYFFDVVFTASSGTNAVMNDVNLDGDDAAGSGTCVLR